MSFVDSLTPKVLWFVLGIIVISIVLYFFAKPRGKLCSWLEIQDRKEVLERVDLYENYAEFYFEGMKPMHVGLLNDNEHTQSMMKDIFSKVTTKDGLVVNYVGTSMSEKALGFIGIVAWIVPFIFFPAFVMILTRSLGGVMASVAGVAEGKSNKLTGKVMFRVEKGSNTRFHDIAGMTEAKQEITEIVDFLKFPDRYTKLGAKLPTGALLLGPPGTGKTLLAKAVAGEAGVAFIPAAGSDFVELYVGMGALRVRQLFELAKKQRCIIYIDEIDAIGLKRSGAGHGEKQEQEHTLNELLTQLDGFGSNRGDVMILASSNVSQDQLDPALIRPGRFDRLVHVDAPVIKERIDIFKVHLSNLRLVSPARKNDCDSDNKSTSGASGDENVDVGILFVFSDGTTTTTAELTELKVEKDATTAESSGHKKTVDTVSTTNASIDPTAAAKDTHKTTTTITALAISGPSVLEQDSFTGLDDNNNKDGMRRNMQEAAKNSLEEKLSKLSEDERHLVNVYAVRMSDLCPGFVGADIANVCNEAAILAARNDCDHVNITHLERSIDRVLAGIEHRSRVLSPFEKKVVAHHEAGHAVAGWFLGRADPLMKVSIVPRGGSALGYAQYLPNENHLQTSNEIKDSICVTLGGKVAELIFFNHLSTGASDDLRKVTRMAYMYVSGYSTTTAHHAPGTSATRYVKPFGAAISDKIDIAAKQLVDEMFERTVQLLTEKKHEMELLAKHLLEYEVLTHADVIRYLGDRPGRPTDWKSKKTTTVEVPSPSHSAA